MSDLGRQMKNLGYCFGICAGLMLPSSLLTLKAESAHMGGGPVAPDQRPLDSYRGKTMMLKGSYCGNQLKFNSEGQLLKGGLPGAWTLCRDIHIEDIKLHGDKIKINGRRIYLIFDSRHNDFRNLQEVVDKTKNSYAGFDHDQNVSIELPSPAGADDAGLQVALEKIFWPETTVAADTVPEAWQSYFKKQSQAVEVTKNDSWAATGVFRVADGVKPPKVTHTPDPSYTDAARKAQLQGTCVLSVIIGTDGQVHNVEVSRPLGLGLDEHAMEAIRTWRFEPAARNGRPVAVQVSVEVSFSLHY